MTFEQWLAAVDREVIAICGISVHELPDWDFWNAWNDGVPPEEAAEEVLINADFPIDLL